MQMGSTFAAVGRYAAAGAAGSAMVLTTLFATTGETPATRHIMVQRPNPNAVHTYIQTWGHSGSQVGGIRSNGDLNLSGSILANGVSVNSGAFLNYPIIPLTGSGVAAATGTNVWGNVTMPYAGSILDADAFLSEVADNNLTTVDVKINGTSIFSTQVTIDATETGSHLAAASPVINDAANDFLPNSKITFDVLSPATTPGKDLKLNLKVKQTTFP